MKICEDKFECYELAEKYFENSYNRILNRWSIKKLLNDFYKPENYIFFYDEDFLLPLVSKNGIVTFFGGDLPYNEENILASSEKLNFCFDYLKRKNFYLKLTSIQNDCFEFLNEHTQKLDVPYNQNWMIKDFHNFDFENHIKSLDKKNRKKINKSLDILNSRIVKNYVDDKTYLKSYRDKIFQLKIDFFNIRNKKNAWENKKILYDQLIQEFFKFESINCIFHKNDASNQIVGSYNLVFEGNEILLAFSNSYDHEDDYVTFALYVDMITTCKKYVNNNQKKNIVLNASRGNFGYKKKFGFQPIPMYALVDMPTWSTSYNKDISIEQTLNLYKRNFGCFK